mgnify:CR=1 FL=1
MDTSRLLLGILLMFLATYLPRALPLALLNKRIKSPFLLAFFNYIPYAVLTALTIPAIFTATQSVPGAAVGFADALFLSLRGKPLITVALGGAGVVWLVEGLLMRLL